MLNGLLAAEGIDWVGPPGAATAVSVVMPLNGDRGFLSACPEFEIDTDALAALEPRAVVIDLPVVERAPAGADVHAVVGDVDARRLAGHLPAALADARTLLANEPEALIADRPRRPRIGRSRPGRARPYRGGHAGAGGALCAGEHGLVRAPAPEVTAVDTNGAGDLFTAAWVWADLAGVPAGASGCSWPLPMPRCPCEWPQLVTALSRWTRSGREAHS